MKKLRVGVLGATGMVGQKFISLLENHPWFEVTTLAASPRSKGKTYIEAVGNRWSQPNDIPKNIANIIIKSVIDDIENIADEVNMVFCALDMDKNEIKKIEEEYAKRNVAVISNNSAHRWSEDVPMIIPEVNPSHSLIIDYQRKIRKWNKGLIAVKSNCSIQSYVPALHVLKEFGLEKIIVTTFQAISGAGKNFNTWPEMIDNVIPLINGEEEKSEKEPLKIWSNIVDGKFVTNISPQISASCIRVPVTDGHMAIVNVKFSKIPKEEEIIHRWLNYNNPILNMNLPSAPKKFIKYFEEENRPQTKLDRMIENGMGISVGRLREDNILDWKFVGLSHNTIRGAAGGAILMAELLYKQGYIS